MMPPTYGKEVHQFMGEVTYYRDMRERCSTKIMPNKVKCTCTKIKHVAFE